MSQREDMDRDWIGRLSVDDLRYKLRGALNELVLVEDTLAGALGYPRSDGGPDDPNGGGYVTGEHTAVTLEIRWQRHAYRDGHKNVRTEALASGRTIGMEDALRTLTETFARSLPRCAVHPEADR